MKWGARQSVSAAQLSSLLGNTQQAKRTSHYEWLLCKTKQQATELRTGDLQNIGLSERSQFKKVTSIQFHVYDTLKKAKGTEIRSVAARVWGGGLKGHTGISGVMEIIYLLIMEVVSGLCTLVNSTVHLKSTCSYMYIIFQSP